MRFALFVSLAGIVAGVAVPATDNVKEALAAELVPRQTGSYTGINCGGRWGTVTGAVAAQLIADIAGVTSSSSHAADTCGPVAQQCTNGKPEGRLGWCSADHAQCIPYSTLASRYQQVAGHCNTNGNAAGQAFYADGSNVIIQQPGSCTGATVYLCSGATVELSGA